VQEQSVTRHAFRTLYSGAELVVAGRLNGTNVTGQVLGHSSSGSTHYPFDPVVMPTTATANTMERLWAYLTIRQLLEGEQTNDDFQTSPAKERALQLALTVSTTHMVTTFAAFYGTRRFISVFSDPCHGAAKSGRTSYLRSVAI
jgi:hypothetical protein